MLTQTFTYSIKLKALYVPLHQFLSDNTVCDLIKFNINFTLKMGPSPRKWNTFQNFTVFKHLSFSMTVGHVEYWID